MDRRNHILPGIVGALPVLHPAGSVASAELHIMIITVVLSGTVVIPVFALLFWFAWKYRASNPETAKHHRPQWDHFNPAFEFFWWLVPSAIIAVLSVVAWQSAHALDPYVTLQGSTAPLTIEVVALDWKWLFIYPEQGIASVNTLEIPVGSPIHFEITADAPMNSFWIPSLAGQIMAMPGMMTQLNLLADTPGIYNGVSANISGAGFAGMNFPTRAVPRTDFDAWVETVKRSATPLSRNAYEALAKPSRNDSAAYYWPVDPTLYTGIIMRFMTPQRTVATTTSTDTSGMEMSATL